jgi:hypothetical protein
MKVRRNKNIHTNKDKAFVKLMFITFIFLSLASLFLLNKVRLLSKVTVKTVDNPVATNIASPTATPTPTPSPKRVIEQTTPTSDPKKAIGDCRGATGSKCEGKSIKISLEACQSGSYTCCPIGSGWEIIPKQQCLEINKPSESEEFVLVTLPHDLKQYYCPKGIDSKIYNMSLDIVNKTIEMSDDEIAQQFFLEATQIVNDFTKKYCK